MASERHLSKKLSDVIERRMSRSLTDIPQVTVTNNEQLPHLVPPHLDDLRETRSQPCSPTRYRRAFTTRIDGTQYIIGNFLFFVIYYL